MGATGGSSDAVAYVSAAAQSPQDLRVATRVSTLRSVRAANWVPWQGQRFSSCATRSQVSDATSLNEINHFRVSGASLIDSSVDRVGEDESVSEPVSEPVSELLQNDLDNTGVVEASAVIEQSRI